MNNYYSSFTLNVLARSANHRARFLRESFRAAQLHFLFLFLLPHVSCERGSLSAGSGNGEVDVATSPASSPTSHYAIAEITAVIDMGGSSAGTAPASSLEAEDTNTANANLEN